MYVAMNDRHYETALCRDGVARRVQFVAAKRMHLTLSQMFTMYGKKLERAEVFKYLGHLLAYNDNDAQAVRGNLKKAHVIWSRLCARSENASPHACGIFFKGTVQSILLFGSKTGNLSPLSLKLLERVSHQGRLAYGRQEANETSGWYLDVPKLSAGS
jgi:hypothetical protein